MDEMLCPVMRMALWAVLVQLPLIHALSASDLAQLTAGGHVQAPEVDSGKYYELAADGTPNHETGDFPTSYNPNSIKEQTGKIKVPTSPKNADTPLCLPMGPIGVTISGVYVFNPLTFEGYDAVTGEHAEEFDKCDGHPQQDGMYHYHKPPSCIAATAQNKLVGIAYDGYPIYGKIDENGKTLTSADLDECHGKETNGEYRYHFTDDYPYVLGCYKGEVSDQVQSDMDRQGAQCKTAIADNHGSSATSVHPPLALLTTFAMIAAAIPFNFKLYSP